MTIVTLLALVGWIPVGVVMFVFLPSRTAATAALIGAWLLLPPYKVDISGLPDFSKNMSATTGMMLGTLLFAPDRLLNFRPRWFDLPMVLWSLCGIASSLYNGLGLYDGLSDALNQTITWGLPYLLGRVYFGSPEDLRFIAVGMVIGGLAFVLPCLFEMKMSPRLLTDVYGGGGSLDIRLGGYRPKVFFFAGLELGLWMMAASLSAWWLWRRGALKQIGGVPFGSVLFPILLGTTILCRSTGALVLLLGGMVLLWLSLRFKTRLLLAGLLLVGPVYAAVRATNLWSGQQAVDLATAVVGPVRAESLEYRFKCENLLAAKALQQPVFGWGGFDRSYVFFDGSTDMARKVPTDGLWIIILGTKGLFGLTLFYVAFILPAFLFVWRFPARQWSDPRLAAGTLAATFMGLYMIDCLLNGFLNIIYITLAGGLAGLEPRQLRAHAAWRGVGAHRATAPGPAAVAMAPRATPIVLAERYRGLGRSFKQDGRLDDAESAWMQALDLLAAPMGAESDIPGLRRLWCDCANDLAWLRANHPDPARRDPEAAVAMARRMVEAFPEAETYWNTLGVAYYRAGDDASAIAALEHATALGGGTAFDDVFLALAHARQGDPEAARRVFDRALIRAERDHPGHPELARFCDEAHSVLDGSPGTPAAAH